jgi:DNA-binding NarL/FixJ family response regulator
MQTPKRLQVAPVDARLQPDFSQFLAHIAFARDEPSGGRVSHDRLFRVLIVEDDYLVSSEMEIELIAAGFEIVGVAFSAKEAIRLATATAPDLVVMDIRLGGSRDGVDAALEIFRARGIRSLFASAHHDLETRRRAEAALPLGWLPKPYTMASLVDAVHKAARDLRNPG